MPGEVLGMKLRDMLKPGLPIDLYLPAHANAPYFSRVQEHSKDSILIGSPLEAAFRIVSIGETVRVDFRCENALYTFSSTVVEKKKQRGKVLLVLKAPESLQKVDRREFFRLKVSVPVRYRVLPAAAGARYKTTSTKNLSGGGLLLLLDEPVAIGTMLDLGIELEGEEGKTEMLLCLGRVATIREEGNRPEVGVAFVDIEEKDRERLFRFLFAREQLMRSRRTGMPDDMGRRLR